MLAIDGARGYRVRPARLQTADPADVIAVLVGDQDRLEAQPLRLEPVDARTPDAEFERLRALVATKKDEIAALEPLRSVELVRF